MKRKSPCLSLSVGVCSCCTAGGDHDDGMMMMMSCCCSATSSFVNKVVEEENCANADGDVSLRSSQAKRGRTKRVLFHSKVEVWIEDDRDLAFGEEESTFRKTIVSLKENDGAKMDTYDFQVLVLSFLERHQIQDAGDILALFSGKPLMTFVNLSKKCEEVINRVQETGRFCLLPSTSRLTSEMVPYLRRLLQICEQALDEAARDVIGRVVQMEELELEDGILVH